MELGQAIISADGRKLTGSKMDDSLIHHYTSIGALAAILRHKTIRFGRLDTLDDTQEAQSIGGFDFGQMLFASCWVEKSEEDIAQ